MKTVDLNNGVQMPIIGFGGHQIADSAKCEQCVYDASMAGYRCGRIPKSVQKNHIIKNIYIFDF